MGGALQVTVEPPRLGAVESPMEMSPQDRELDRLWRARFGEPLPMLGCAAIARRVLLAAGDKRDEPRPRRRAA